MKKLLTIAVALAAVCPAPSVAVASPPPPAVLEPYIHNGHFDPGNYGWLRGYYPGASASDQVDFHAINDWRNACVAASKKQMRAELQAVGVADPSLDNLPPSDPLCSEVIIPFQLNSLPLAICNAQP